MLTSLKNSLYLQLKNIVLYNILYNICEKEAVTFTIARGSRANLKHSQSSGSPNNREQKMLV